MSMYGVVSSSRRDNASCFNRISASLGDSLLLRSSGRRGRPIAQGGEIVKRIRSSWSRLGPIRVVLVAVAAGAGLWLAAAAVQADTFPDNHHDGLADSSIHTYCFRWYEGDENVGHYAMRNALDNTTDMSDVLHSTCYDSTDVIFRDYNLAGGRRGQYQCKRYYSDGDCNSSEVVFDWAQLDIGSNDWYDRRKTSVHEVGHSVGCNHDSVSAMITGEIPSTALQWRRFSSHDLGHINANY